MTDLIRRELLLPVSPAEAWRAVTDPDQLCGWLADQVRLELWPGGDACFEIDGRELSGWVEEACPPDERCEGRLAFWWAADGEPASRVALTLSPTDAGTVLRVVETRPLDALDLIGIPLPGHGGHAYGPALVAA
ncbi:MAG: SRPBCC family protein [Solirubrobacteraceae bacterium]